MGCTRRTCWRWASLLGRSSICARLPQRMEGSREAEGTRAQTLLGGSLVWLSRTGMMTMGISEMTGT